MHKILIAFVALTGCATAPEVSPSFSLPSSTMNNSVPSYSAGPSAGEVHIEADLVVRPDVICVPFVVVTRGGDVVTGLNAAQAATSELKVGGRVRIDDIAISPPTHEAEVNVRGVVEVDLPERDAFERGAVVAGLVRALSPFATEKQPRKLPVKPNTPTMELRYVIGAATPGLKDTEQHRQALLEGWAGRVKALQSSVGGVGVDLGNCSAPGPVRLAGGTLEKVGLNLAVSCAVNVKSH
ncbi:MAG: hypothetical protein Q8O67_19055 [Deltaproteobacteria bacterium]|nr:hypothetical protein [Deltaproteobacteria bacterium]